MQLGQHLAKLLPKQWSFRETGTMGMPTSQAVIGIWVLAPRRFCGPPGGITPENFL